MEQAQEGPRRSVEALLPLTPAVFQIMLSIADSERHGYSILREVERNTDGQVKLGPTTLYRSIRQMLAAGLIEETEERPDPALDDERRHYYRLTTFGRQVALAEMRRLEWLVAMARATSLGGQPGGLGFAASGSPGRGGGE
ncbi:MAG TPA: PadR family transcriptional regulator [Ktedonobacterales bacterium]|nr:PadR family transcriptional regulator [Ktedonobacterales bacterium]